MLQGGKLVESRDSHKIKRVSREDEGFPERLRTIPSPPKELYYIGELPDPAIPAVAIIGSRRNSLYGYACARSFSAAIAQAGIQVISGMARGIDGVAQQSALKEGAKSYAILGCGVDVCYPPENQQLYEQLMVKGGVISEYEPGTVPLGRRFPARNRIISGLSDAVIVIEAGKKSGTMITVDMALEQGREVYALPGRIDDVLSAGCNELIRQGAGILTSPEDFLADFLTHISEKEEYRPYIKNRILSSDKDGVQTSLFPSTPEERAILNVMDYTPQPVDVILARVNCEIPMPLPNLMQWLTNMTISGYIACMAGGNYHKVF